MGDVAPARVVVFGGTGRMGSAVVRKLSGCPGLVLAGCVRRSPNGSLEGVDASNSIVSLSDLLASADVAIDFTLPEAVENNLALCGRYAVAYVCGVTALDKQTQRTLSETASLLPVLWAPNMSTGVTVCFGAAHDIAARLGTGFSVAITDIHHAGKQDAPSGTALEFGRVIEQASSGKVEITYESVREGAHPGEHHIVFGQGTDRVELRHVAHDRGEFASGAIRAAQWLVGQEPGAYNMRNVLGITTSS